LAVPVVRGRKSDKEKFAGGFFTTTVEAYIPAAGRAIQGATSHCLGQNFAHANNIQFFGEDKEKHYVWQNSWGMTTRTIGVMVMVHGDDKGLVLPPRVAPVQVVIITITSSSTSADVVDALDDKAYAIKKDLEKIGIKVKVDGRNDKTAGWKYAYWEQKGVPLRLELGPKDLEKGSAMGIRRDTFAKASIPFETLVEDVDGLMKTIQSDMLEKARQERDENIAIVMNFKDFKAALKKGRLCLTPWCEETESEEWVKEMTGPNAPDSEEGASEEVDERALSGAAKTLCLPIKQPPLPKGTLCFTGNGKPATAWCLWGRSY